jgi:hypothetical protein
MPMLWHASMFLVLRPVGFFFSSFPHFDWWVVVFVSRSLRSYNYVRMQHFVRQSTSVPFRRFWGDVRREFMQRLYAPLHGTLGSYLRDAFQEGTADAVACLPVPVYISLRRTTNGHMCTLDSGGVLALHL